MQLNTRLGPVWRPDRVTQTLVIGLTTLLSVVTGGAAHAQAPPDTLRLAEATALARAANPGLQAARLRADAAAERIPQAGAWSDPMLSFGLMNRPVDDFGTSQPMTMNAVQLTQRFPWPGKLGFAEKRAEHLALAEGLEAAEVEQQLVARVKSVYYRLAYTDRSLDIMRETRKLLRNFFEVSSTLYAVGTGLQQDVLQAQIAIAQMTEDITVVEQNRVAMAARLNALLGRDATVLVPRLELPEPVGDLPPVDSLMDLAAQLRPALAAARERVLAAEAGYRAARRQLYPDIAITLGYGQRPQFVDFVTVMVGVSIPLFAGSRQLPLRSEMQAMRSMEQAREQDLYNETFARLTELRAEAERAQNLSRLYTNAVLPQARASVESALSAYRVGRVDYMTLVSNEMTVNRYEIESVRLAADYHRALAELEALVGTGLGGGR
jgi:outer membrane protein TolC